MFCRAIISWNAVLPHVRVCMIDYRCGRSPPYLVLIDVVSSRFGTLHLLCFDKEIRIRIFLFLQGNEEQTGQVSKGFIHNSPTHKDGPMSTLLLSLAPGLRHGF